MIKLALEKEKQEICRISPHRECSYLFVRCVKMQPMQGICVRERRDGFGARSENG